MLQMNCSGKVGSDAVLRWMLKADGGKTYVYDASNSGDVSGKRPSIIISVVDHGCNLRTKLIVGNISYWRN